MKRKLYFLIIITMMMVMIFPTAALGKAPAPNTPQKPDRPALQEVPQEVKDFFKDGVSVEDFLAKYNGPVPNALKEFSDAEITVVVEMKADPLAVPFASRQSAGQMMSASNQQAYIKDLKVAQDAVANDIRSMNGTVIDQYQKVYNGLLVRVPLNKLDQIKALPNVKAVHRAPLYHPDLTASVPLINADDVWNFASYTGEDVTIAIIDTGIDYTHIAFGGSGDPNEYANNDPSTLAITDTFPSAKVIGGYDFAGTDYNGYNTPVPDPDPLDEYGHGTHVASIAAGVGVTGTIGLGVAPDALLYAYKVFGKEGSTNLTISGIEAAVDPNGDGDLSDHVDVINMSLGSDYGPDDPDDPTIFAADFASSIGVVVVASAGNAGNTPYIQGSPAAADSVISVAASTTGYATGPTVSISGTSALTLTDILYNPPAFDDNTGHYTSAISATLAYVGAYTTTDTLCTTGGITPTNALDGKIALIQRGDCAFTDKVNNAAALGAVGAIIFNHAAGGDSLVTMAGPPVVIPAGFVGHTDGTNLVTANGEVAIVSAESDVTTIPSSIPPDTIAPFSSRGPRGFDSILKPDITAPGVSIFAAKMGGGDEGVSFSGTSMAAPHIAGVAALLKQEHPDWTPEMIKAAMMNTAVDLNDPDSAEVPRQGAGRVDAWKAVTTNAVAIGDPDLVSLNWGFFTTGSDLVVKHKNITLVNTGHPIMASPVSPNIEMPTVYNVTWYFGSNSMEDGFSLTVPPTVTLTGASIVPVPVVMTFDATAAHTDFGTMEEYYGYIEFTPVWTPVTPNGAGPPVLRVPFYAVPRPYSDLNISDMGEGTFEMENSGPITASVWTYPVFGVSGNDPLVGDEGDLRYVGMDYGGNSPYGDIIVPAFNTYGSWHTPQPYFSEMDLYIDADGDSVTDFIDFNFNYGWFSGGDDTDVWIVVQVFGGYLYLASPYLIYADYNAGFQEWYLPTAWNALDPSDLDFDFMAIGWDYHGNGDIGGAWYYDATYYTPIYNGWTGDPAPGATEDLFIDYIDPMHGMTPDGLMVVDYNGEPGEGQAHFLPMSDLEYYAVDVAPPSAMKASDPGTSVDFTLTVSNTGNITDTYSLDVSGPWTATLSDSFVSVDAYESTVVTVTVDIPADALGGAMNTFTFTATSSGDATVFDKSMLTIDTSEYKIFVPIFYSRYVP